MNSRIPLLIFSLLCLVAAPLQAETINTARIKWILSGQSPSLDKSSAALAKNQLKRGIRYAHKALDYARDPLHQYLASHNLCMGYLISAEPAKAGPFCASMQTSKIPDFQVSQRGENTYEVSRRGQVPAAALLQENLQAARLDAEGMIAGTDTNTDSSGPVN